MLIDFEPCKSFITGNDSIRVVIVQSRYTVTNAAGKPVEGSHTQKVLQGLSAAVFTATRTEELLAMVTWGNTLSFKKRLDGFSSQNPVPNTR